MLDQTSLDIRPSYDHKIRLLDFASQVSQPAIARSCRLIRHDTLPILYGETLFTLRIHALRTSGSLTTCSPYRMRPAYG